MTKDEFNKLPWHAVCLMSEWDKMNFIQTLSGLREVGFILHGQTFTSVEYENGLPVRTVFHQLLIKNQTRPTLKG